MNYVAVITFLSSFFFCSQVALASSCDEFDKYYITQRLFILQIRGETTENMKKDFILMARRCGFNINTGSILSEKEKLSKKGSQPSKKYIANINDNFDALIINIANHNKIDPALVKAVIHVESGFDVYAVSSKGAIGLSQVMPATAINLGVKIKDLWDPEINIETGVRYLALNLYAFGSVKKALIAYNAGPSMAARVNGPEDLAMIPEETRTYLKRVLALYRIYKSSGH